MYMCTYTRVCVCVCGLKPPSIVTDHGLDYRF